jgi:hypothetical protein
MLDDITKYIFQRGRNNILKKKSNATKNDRKFIECREEVTKNNIDIFKDPFYLYHFL